MGTTLLTQAEDWWRMRTVNSTDANFPTRGTSLWKSIAPGSGGAAAQTTPARYSNRGDATGERGSWRGVVSNRLACKFYGGGNDDDTFLARVYGWSLLHEGVESSAIWEPILLCQLALTLSTMTGVAGGLVTATDRWADTIVVTYGNAGVSVEAMSPANNLPAHAVIDFKGCELIEFTFDRNGSATSCNGLWRRY